MVYFLSLGDEDPDHPMSGRFCIGDPRLRACCQFETGASARRRFTKNTHKVYRTLIKGQ